ncbi:hypothetical protein [Ideonella paludis]|uniref:Transposase n=1 Tax=Ideonella paludis TaxID=1233411 RepID=A0ABS5E3C5_9BURK|nr:hypothetical protein [Ideonella paludis]MBQ0937876.1 hypothetical protein [Ideonella paludis]
MLRRPLAAVACTGIGRCATQRYDKRDDRPLGVKPLQWKSVDFAAAVTLIVWVLLPETTDAISICIERFRCVFGAVVNELAQNLHAKGLIFASKHQEFVPAGIYPPGRPQRELGSRAAQQEYLHFRK